MNSDSETAEELYSDSENPIINGGHVYLETMATAGRRSEKAKGRQRKFLPSLADLVDRLTIAQQKMIFIHEKKELYAAEIADIMHDIDLVLEEIGHRLTASDIRAICVIMLSNRFIWENESKIRDNTSNEPDDVKLHRLMATHSINGVRNNAKNELAKNTNGRQDYKIDCFAAELIDRFGNWNIF